MRKGLYFFHHPKHINMHNTNWCTFKRINFCFLCITPTNLPIESVKLLDAIIFDFGLSFSSRRWTCRMAHRLPEMVDFLWYDATSRHSTGLLWISLNRCFHRKLVWNCLIARERHSFSLYIEEDNSWSCH